MALAQAPAYMRGLHIDPGFRTPEEAYEYLARIFPIGRSTWVNKAVTGEPYVTIEYEGSGQANKADVLVDLVWMGFWECLYRYAEEKLSARSDCMLYFRKLPELRDDESGGRCKVQARLLLSSEPELDDVALKYAAIEPHPPMRPESPPPYDDEAGEGLAAETGLEDTVAALGRRLHDRVGALKGKGHDPRCIAIALTKIEEAGLWIAQAKKKGTFL